MSNANYIEENNRYFRKSAKKYDRNTSIISSLRKHLFDCANPTQGDKVLDVATGTGAVALQFAGKGFETIGIDLSGDMLGVAQSKVTTEPIQFLKGDASQLSFKDESFDIVTVSFALHDMPMGVRVKALKEIKRVLRPGGRFVIMDYALPPNRLWRGISLGIINIYEELNFRQFIKSDFIGLLNEIGFRVITENKYGGGVIGLWMCTEL